MNRFRHALRNLARDQRGLTTVEYIIVLCLIVGVAVATWDTFGGHVHSALTAADGSITAAFGLGEGEGEGK